MSARSSLCAVALAFTLAGGALAQQGAPSQMAFQGRLVRSDGTPESGAHTLVFSLYSTPNGGSALWQETVGSVPVSNGYYSLILGGGTPLDPNLFGGERLYLGVAIAGQSEFSPRINLVSVPYAVKSAKAEDSERLGGLPASDFASSSHSHPAATSSVSGFMSSADKATVDAAITSAGSGLSKSGNSLSVSFSGSGSANSASRSDHGHRLSCTYRTNSGPSGGIVTAWCTASETLTGGGCAGGAIGSFGPTSVNYVSGSTDTGGPGYRCTNATDAFAVCCSGTTGN